MIGVITTINVGDLTGAGRNHFGLCGQRPHPFPEANHTEVKVKALSQRVSRMVLATHQSDALESFSPQTAASRALERRRKKSVPSRRLSRLATVLLAFKPG